MGQIVVVDPGHGGFEVRGRSTPHGVAFAWGGREKDLVLSLAREVGRRLGSRAVLTRQRDVNLSLADRIACARAAGADTFLSLHANPAARTETFVHPRAGARSQRLATALGRALGGPVSTAELAVLSPDHHRPGTAACLIEVGGQLQAPAEIQRLGGAIAGALKIIPPTNDMQVIDDIRGLPFRWIARLEVGMASARTRGHIFGTGTLIEPGHILTSAHNLVERDPQNATAFTDISKIQVSLGGLGPIAATGYWVHDQWMHAMMDTSLTAAAAGDLGTPFDYGIIRLAERVGERIVDGSPFGYWGPVSAIDPSTFSEVLVGGWPQPQCVTNIGGTYPALVWARGASSSPLPGDRMVDYEADTCPDQSGAPVWIETDSGPMVAGVHHGAKNVQDLNTGVFMTQEVVDTIRHQIDGPSAWRISTS